MSIFQDWKSNRGRSRIQFGLVLMRLAQLQKARIPSILCKAVYKLYAGIILGIDLPASTRIGPGLQIHHGIGLVVHGETVIGSDVVLRHSTTIGQASPNGGVPVIADGVDIGANVVIIGPIAVGQGATVGAGAVVTKSVPAMATVVSTLR